MLRNLFLGASLAALAGSASAQTTVFAETFDSGVVPPTGWTELNNGVSLGWESDSTGTAAWHDDFYGANDNSLLSPAFDASGVSELYLHGLQGQLYPTWRDLNLIEVTLDGGLTFTAVYSETGTDTGDYLPMNVNLSTYAGISSIQLNFRFIGDYANEWDLYDIQVRDDPPPPPPPTWTHLPTTFFPAYGFRENFDSLNGFVPSHMALNALDEATRNDDPEAWCNIGQAANCMDPYDGNACLEMGLMPGSSNSHLVSNALVIGLNGAGATNMIMTFQAMEFGEEVNANDGVFVSEDGLIWEPCLTEWHTHAGQSEYNFVVCDLASTTVNVSGDFYVAIAQEDDYEFAYLDGVSIDNITINCPLYQEPNLVGGSTANFELNACTPGSFVSLVYSRTPGPTVTPYGIADVGSPYTRIGSTLAGGAGNVNFSESVPAAATGHTVWTQAVEIASTSARFSNGFKLIVQ